MPGPAEDWQSKPFAQPPVLGGVVLSVGSPLATRSRKAGAQLLEMANGSVVIQLPFTDVGGAENPAYREFRFDQVGVVEADWYDAVDDLLALGQSQWFIPYTVETEAFVAFGGQTTFSLTRPTAVSQYVSFDTVEFPARAFLNGTEQTVISSGTPAAGEVKIVSAAITTPALVAADRLVVRYYPAYAVVLSNPPLDAPAYNDINRSVQLIETALQVPV